MKNILAMLICTATLIGCTHLSKQHSELDILPVSQVKWEKLNLARGDNSPQAATLWGDRKGEQATGFLVKFVDGFSSPPHIHNVSYKAIVIEGLIHNDDPKAATMWMPKESYWTQPAGEAHITSAKGETNIAFVEIDNGPYLVKPTTQKFDNGERPYNIHASNIIWRDKGNYKIVELRKDKNEVVTGSLLKFNKTLKIISTDAKLVLITGTVLVKNKTLTPGSLISTNGASTFSINCQSQNCTVYLKTNEKSKIL